MWPAVPFYLYNDPILLYGLMYECMRSRQNELESRQRWTMPYFDLRYNASLGTVHEFAAAKYFARLMMTHPWRTMDPAQAEVFIVPTDVEPVFLEPDGPCGVDKYEGHLWETLREVFEQPYIRAKNGADHFWMMSANDPERLIEKYAPFVAQELRRVNHLHFLVVGVMELFPGRSLMALPAENQREVYVLNGTRRSRAWRCSLPVPFVHSFPFSEHGVAFSSFEVWMRREYIFYHQFSGFYQDERSRQLRGQALKIPQAAADPRRVWVGDRFVSSEELARGFRSSRFCLAIAGRKNGGPTRKFYDAVASACIPVVVSDQWLFSFAPFPGHLQHEAYAVFVPEDRWLNDLAGVIRELEAMPRRELLARYKALREAAPVLVYDRPDSHALGSVLLWEMNSRCGHTRRDEEMYPVGQPLRRPRPRKVNGSRVAEALLRVSGPKALAWRRNPSSASQYIG
ncbi:unnamed protein product [Effrenium voratum]|uniref:Exostosin GT47 domain-containing protein n=1 Tax=Effrenium voratum TaxID=2562239 RepID=A0AA36HUL2_9DINO|nr:unnamed protein product [Effrenium voratum]